MIALAILAAAAAQAAAPVDPVAAYGDCLVANARQLDDGRSDAATIAEVVRVQCKDVERVAAVALSGDDAFENRRIVVAQIEAGSLGRAIRAVLRVRTAR